MPVLLPPAQMSAEPKRAGEMLPEDRLERAGPEGKAILDACARM